MNTTTEPTTRRRVRTPVVYAEAEVSLDEFSTADIIKYLQDMGEEAGGTTETANGNGLYITPFDLNRIETLAVCGQADAARAFVMQIISEAIGRQI